VGPTACLSGTVGDALRCFKERSFDSVQSGVCDNLGWRRHRNAERFAVRVQATAISEHLLARVCSDAFIRWSSALSDMARSRR